jgi:hypothetical protein
VSYKIYDYYCVKHPEDVSERLVKDSAKDEQYCECCQEFMVRVVPAPHGKVIGTRTPVRFRK